jgi:hypothetical protein
MFEQALQAYKLGDVGGCENIRLYSYEYLKYLRTAGTPMSIEELFKKYDFCYLCISRMNPMNKK